MKRRLIIVVLLLLAGAVVNVAVAWSCATISPVNVTLSQPPMPEPGDTVVDRAFQGLGVAMSVRYSLAFLYHVDLDVMVGWPLSAFVEESWRYYQIRIDFRSEEFMRSTELFSREPLSDEEMVRIDPSGDVPGTEWLGYGSRSDEEMRRFLETIASLPDTKRADRLLKRRARKTDLGAFILERDRIVRDLIKQAQATPRRHSLRRPLWPGFAVNTLFYAVVLWLLIPGPFALRRFIRVRRGLCPACAYPRGESDVCSECGKALPNSRGIV